MELKELIEYSRPEKCYIQLIAELALFKNRLIKIEIGYSLVICHIVSLSNFSRVLSYRLKKHEIAKFIELIEADEMLAETRILDLGDNDEIGNTQGY